MIGVEADVVISDLTGSFSRLWESAEQACEGLHLTRSLTQNLILVTTPEQSSLSQELIGDLLDRHPCRAIVVIIHTNSCPLKATLSGLIRDQRKTRTLVLEKLVLETDWGHFRKLPNLIRPLLVSDIATSLFWAAKLPDDPQTLSAIASLGDHTIVDSTLFGKGDWQRLEQIHDHSPLDLAWLRVSPWRRTLAEAFEHFEWNPKKCETQVTLEHGPGFGSHSACRCLASWLTKRLQANVQLQRRQGGGPDGEPWLLDLKHGPIHVQIRHLKSEPRLQTNITLQNHCLLPTYTQVTGSSRPQLLASAIDLAW